MKDHLLETIHYIYDYQQKYFNSPSLEEISNKLGTTGGAISFRIKQLIEGEYIERFGNRALRITQKGYDAIGARTQIFD